MIEFFVDEYEFLEMIVLFFALGDVMFDECVYFFIVSDVFFFRKGVELRLVVCDGKYSISLRLVISVMRFCGEEEFVFGMEEVFEEGMVVMSFKNNFFGRDIEKIFGYFYVIVIFF